MIHLIQSKMVLLYWYYSVRELMYSITKCVNYVKGLRMEKNKKNKEKTKFSEPKIEYRHELGILQLILIEWSTIYYYKDKLWKKNCFLFRMDINIYNGNYLDIVYWLTPFLKFNLHSTNVFNVAFSMMNFSFHSVNHTHTHTEHVFNVFLVKKKIGSKCCKWTFGNFRRKT